MEHYLMSTPAPSIVKKYVVEIKDNGVIASGLLVCDNISITNTELAMLYGVRAKQWLKPRSRCGDPEIGCGYRNYNSGKCDTDIKVAYHDHHPFVVLGKDRIVNVFGIENMDAFPVTAVWSTTTRAQAQEQVDELVRKHNYEVAVSNTKLYELVLKQYRKDQAEFKAKAEWEKMSKWERMFKKRDAFINTYVANNHGSVPESGLQKILDACGAKYRASDLYIIIKEVKSL